MFVGGTEIKVCLGNKPNFIFLKQVHSNLAPLEHGVVVSYNSHSLQCQHYITQSVRGFYFAHTPYGRGDYWCSCSAALSHRATTLQQGDPCSIPRAAARWSLETASFFLSFFLSTMLMPSSTDCHCVRLYAIRQVLWSKRSPLLPGSHLQTVAKCVVLEAARLLTTQHPPGYSKALHEVNLDQHSKGGDRQR